MEEFFKSHDILAKIISAVVIAAFTSWITVRLSIGRFRTEKWWELKAATYTKIIENLHHQKFWAEKHYEAETQRSVNEEFLEKLNQKTTEAYLEFEKILNTGTFILPKNAYDAVVEYNITKQTDDDEPFIWYCETVMGASEKCLQKIIQIAKDDLNPSFLSNLKRILRIRFFDTKN